MTRSVYVIKSEPGPVKIYTGRRVDFVLKAMRRSGMTIDRENYIWKAYGADPPEWSAELELEAELPAELRDWSQFE
jgi:hypothetical protein